MFIVDIKRTPFGKFLGSLSNLSASELTRPLFSYYLNKYPFLKKETDEVIIGNALSVGHGMNPARIVAFNCGIDESVPAYTINHACASGLNAIIQGFRSVKLGKANLILAGGMELMSQTPHLSKGLRKGVKFGAIQLIDALQIDGLYRLHMTS
ncbi:MAG: acetyl-CoA C-acyltransferase, partial [Actinobacteria bacterium]|nr:acetyl-CoA C-acyltransferase [Actinomycetota bacterium]